MINFDDYSKSLDAHITFFEKHYTNDERDKAEVQMVQRDISHKLDKILENSNTMNNDEITQLLIKITKINTLIGMVK